MNLNVRDHGKADILEKVLYYPVATHGDRVQTYFVLFGPNLSSGGSKMDHFWPPNHTHQGTTAWILKFESSVLRHLQYWHIDDVCGLPDSKMDTFQWVCFFFFCVFRNHIFVHYLLIQNCITGTHFCVRTASIELTISIPI